MASINAYTIEYYEHNNGHREQKIAAFPSFLAAHDAATDILKKRCPNPYKLTEVHETNKHGIMCHRIRVWSSRARYQVTIKYHEAAGNGFVYNPW
jgi:hypothetical protein